MIRVMLYLEDDPRRRGTGAGQTAADRMACELRVASESRGIRGRAGPDEFDLILSDYTLPNYCGMAALDCSWRTAEVLSS